MKRSVSSKHQALLALVGSVLVSSPALGQTPYFRPLGFLDPNMEAALPLSVSADGQVAVGAEYFVVSYEGAFRWTPSTGMVALPFSEAVGVSNDGSVIVGSIRTSLSELKYKAIRWTEQEGIVELGYLPGGDNSYSAGVSGDGSVIVGISTSTAAPQYGELFRWTAETGMVALGTPFGALSQEFTCYGVSADGTSIVGHAPPPNSTLNEGYRWRQVTGTVGTGYGIMRSCGANACSGDGSILVGAGSDGHKTRPFWWTEATGMVDLSHACATCYDATAFCTSLDGGILGGDYVDTSLPDSAAMWDAQHGWRLISTRLINEFGITEPAGWYLDYVYGVSPDGQTFVGSGYNPDGYAEGWIAFIPRPAPCPPDVNGDRHVDLADLALLLSKFGAISSNATYSLACDMDRNGVVDLSDLATVLANFGEVCP